MAQGVHRIPLPLPQDGLRAVNVYVIESAAGLTLIDGGWAIEASRQVLERSLRSIGAAPRDIRAFLVTHAHRDHYTQASVLGREVGATISLGAGERSSLTQNLSVTPGTSHHTAALRRAGATDLAQRWARLHADLRFDPAQWTTPDTWFEGDQDIWIEDRRLTAVSTPGHTQGHYVFAETQARVLFAGDHVLPTITPSIGFEAAEAANPLGDFMSSLTKVRTLPDLRLLPAHGPVGMSSHERVDQLLGHHEQRLRACLDAFSQADLTPYDVALMLPWTRHDKAFQSLDVFNAALATLETRAHLRLLVARGDLDADDADGTEVFRLRDTPKSRDARRGPPESDPI